MGRVRPGAIESSRKADHRYLRAKIASKIICWFVRIARKGCWTELIYNVNGCLGSVHTVQHDIPTIRSIGTRSSYQSKCAAIAHGQASLVLRATKGRWKRQDEVPGNHSFQSIHLIPHGTSPRTIFSRFLNNPRRFNTIVGSRVLQEPNSSCVRAQQFLLHGVRR